MKKIRLTEEQLHKVISETVKKLVEGALTEISKNTAQNAYDKLKRKGQYGDFRKDEKHPYKNGDYSERANDLYDNYESLYSDELSDNPTPEEFFEDICSTVERNDGMELSNGWYVDAYTYGADELFFYGSKEDADNEEEPDYRFSDNESQHDKFQTDANDRSVVEELYIIGKNNDFDIKKTLTEFSTDMLG